MIKIFPITKDILFFKGDSLYLQVFISQ